MSERVSPVEDVPTAEFSRPGVASSVPSTSPCLVVISSTTPGAIGHLFRLSGDGAVIGRTPGVEVCLEDHGISRRHARVSAGSDGQFQLEDLRSRNGTYLNGAKITLSALKEGDQIQVGSSTLLRFSLHAELRESEVRLRQALAVGRVGTWDWDAVSGQVLLAGHVEKVFRIAKGPLACSTENFFKLIHVDDRDRLKVAINRALKAGDALHQEFRALSRDGTVRWVEAQGEVIRDSHRRGVRITGILIDSSARKAVEQSLLKQLKTLESLYDSGLLLDPLGRILDWNEAAEKMFGFTKAEALGRLPFQLLRVPQAEQRGRAMRETLNRAGRWSDEVAVLRKDGTERAFEVVVVPLRQDEELVDGESALVAYVSVYRDITERKQLQTRLMLADRLASLGTLAAGVAHEINNPLAYVIANLSFVTHELGTIRDGNTRQIEEALAALKEAQEGAARVNTIVRDLKTFSREEEPSGSSRRGVDVVEVLELAAKMAKNEIRHRAELIQEFRPVPRVRGTESRLGQVFLNLLINAAQAIPEGNASHHRISMATAVEGGRVMVSISDTGIGIAPEVVRRIFDPFFTTKPVGVGTGLGLSICHSLVTALGGEIEVESEPQKGATFRVYLPVSEEAAESKGAQAPLPDNVRHLRRARILVVDDEPLVGSSIRRVLGREHDVLAVSTGADALRLFRSGKRFDLILCDVMMPEMTGMDLTATLTELAPDQVERMVFMTGGAFTDRAKRFLERTARKTVLKPLEPPALRTLVRDAMGG